MPRLMMSCEAASEASSASETVIPEGDLIRRSAEASRYGCRDNGRRARFQPSRLRDGRAEEQTEDDGEDDRQHPADGADEHGAAGALVIERLAHRDDHCQQ